jgi:DNA-binding transcriptional LysR family regulator
MSVVPKEVLADLPAFVAVAERLSFRAAAEALGLTPAALSKAINRLEDRVGEPLLSRTTRRVELTPAGVAFRGRAVEALQLVADGLTAAALGRRLAGSVHVAAPAPVLPLLGARLADLSLRHPSVTLTLHASNAPGPADLTILLGSRLVPSPGAAEVALGAVPLVTVAAPAYVARHGGVAPGRDAAGLHRWLRHDPALQGPDGTDRQSAVLASSDAQALVSAAISGAGVLTTLRPLVAPHLTAGRLVAVAIGDDPAPLPVRARLSPSEEGAMPRVVLALGAVAQALGLPVPEADWFSGTGPASRGQPSGATASAAAAP